MDMMHFDSKDFEIEDFPFTISRDIIRNEFPIHTHGYTEMVVILGGVASQIINRQIFKISEGDVFVIRGKVSHGFINVYNLDICNIMFDADKLLLPLFDLNKIEGFHSLFTIQPFLKNNHPFKNHMRLDFDRLTIVRTYIEKISDEYKNRKPGFCNSIILLLNELIIFLSREYHKTTTDGSSVLNRLSSIIAFMEKNYTQHVKLEELAGKSHLSSRQFSRIFKDTFQQSPMDYLARLRIKHACKLLIESDMSISDIAYRSGFSDPNYFCRTFKKRVNISPLNYRSLKKASLKSFL